MGVRGQRWVTRCLVNGKAQVTRSLNRGACTPLGAVALTPTQGSSIRILVNEMTVWRAPEYEPFIQALCAFTSKTALGHRAQHLVLQMQKLRFHEQIRFLKATQSPGWGGSVPDVGPQCGLPTGITTIPSFFLSYF